MRQPPHPALHLQPQPLAAAVSSCSVTAAQRVTEPQSPVRRVPNARGAAVASARPPAPAGTCPHLHSSASGLPSQNCSRGSVDLGSAFSASLAWEAAADSSSTVSQAAALRDQWGRGVRISPGAPEGPGGRQHGGRGAAGALEQGAAAPPCPHVGGAPSKGIAAARSLPRPLEACRRRHRAAPRPSQNSPLAGGAARAGLLSLCSTVRGQGRNLWTGWRRGGRLCGERPTSALQSP